MSVNPTYLITGVNKGIGFGLLESYLSRPNHTIVAAVRDPTASSSALTALPKAHGTKLIIVKIESASATDAFTAVSELQSKHNITSLDVVIANAGIGNEWSSVLKTSPESVREYNEVNTIGPLILFQATWPLLEKSKDPKFILMGTGISSFTLAEQLRAPSAGYGASKAAVSYIARKIHFEHEALTTVILYPGWVKTELGNELAKSLGAAEAAITVEESVAGVMKVVDEATREKTGGKFIDQEGKPIPW